MNTPSDILEKYYFKKNITNYQFKNEVIRDLWLCLLSREASIVGRKEVFAGRAKFGIFGAGKELAQVALAKFFKKGDYRSGYYRDQTLHFALDQCSILDFFAQLYGDTANDPFSKGRQMNNHFASAFLDDSGQWINQNDQYNITSDISCTAGQMGRALGIAMASEKYRNIKELGFLNGKFGTGDEICFCTIGDASTSEGAFWEVMNAACVHQVPLVVIVWDDGYGISVPVQFQTAKSSISEALKGFQRDENNVGLEILTCKAWDYTELCVTFDKATTLSRKEHVPILIHVEECTQPLGHSTSGSHERYKPKERLAWEKEVDCIHKYSLWLDEQGIIGMDSISALQKDAQQFIKTAKKTAFSKLKANYQPIKEKAIAAIKEVEDENIDTAKIISEIEKSTLATYSDLSSTLKNILYKSSKTYEDIISLINEIDDSLQSLFGTNLYAEDAFSPLMVKEVKPTYSNKPKIINGYQVLNNYFKSIFNKFPNLIAFGEDLGYIGDVNQGFAGLQELFGSGRIYDSGIREWSIIGQALGMAMRGIRPIAEIQYLDYILYGLTPLSDDLATLRYRCNNLQAAPVIIRTRGHRLEGIWHTGSPMGMLLNSVKGIHLCVPRNFVQAIGMYNTLLNSMDPAIVIEPLNSYRLKENLPTNIEDFNTPLGIPEILHSGQDITVVTYGSCVKLALEAIELAAHRQISVELIDVQTLMPFDIHHSIEQSLKKTNRLLIVDEDVPGGASAFILQQILEEQNGYYHLDMKPMTLTAKEHRTPYGDDGDYFSKPQVEDIFECIYKIVNEKDIY